MQKLKIHISEKGNDSYALSFRAKHSFATLFFKNPDIETNVPLTFGNYTLTYLANKTIVISNLTEDNMQDCFGWLVGLAVDYNARTIHYSGVSIKHYFTYCLNRQTLTKTNRLNPIYDSIITSITVANTGYYSSNLL